MPDSGLLAHVQLAAGNQTGTEPHWVITILLGALVGLLLQQYGGVLLYPLRLRRKDPWLGEWWEYHLSHRHGARVLCVSKLTVRRGLRTMTLRAEFRHEPAGDLAYKGTLVTEKNQLLIELDATIHNEHLVYRFVKRIPGSMDVVPGLWMSYDHQDHPAAGAAILCRRQLTEDQALAEILARTLKSGAGLLRIKLT